MTEGCIKNVLFDIRVEDKRLFRKPIIYNKIPVTRIDEQAGEITIDWRASGWLRYFDVPVNGGLTIKVGDKDDPYVVFEHDWNSQGERKELNAEEPLYILSSFSRTITVKFLGIRVFNRV